MTLDIDRNRRIRTLLKTGDSVKALGSAQCVEFYAEALRLSEENNDALRGGEAALALAKAYAYVASVRDYALAETFVTKAVMYGESMGPFGRELVVRAKLTHGNIIAESVQAQRLSNTQTQLANTESWLESAMKLFKAVIASDDADDHTKAAARNGLGNAKSLAGDYAGAAQEYLAACRDYESIGDLATMLGPQSNAALALYNAGQFADAKSVAETGLDIASSIADANKIHLSMLTKVLQAARQALGE